MRPKPRLRGLLECTAVLLTLSACHDLSDSGAERLVRAYNEKLIEAYRTGDERVVDGLVGDEEGKKLLGLIGVRLDIGITLDSQLLELQVAHIERDADRVRLQTKEKWHYADRRIGSGEQVGEASDDSYELRYTLAQIDKKWVVEKVEMVGVPVVSRKIVPWSAGPRVMHGIPPAGAAGAEAKE